VASMGGVEAELRAGWELRRDWKTDNATCWSSREREAAAVVVREMGRMGMGRCTNGAEEEEEEDIVKNRRRKRNVALPDKSYEKLNNLAQK